MLINNDPYQRETLSERPIRQPLNESQLTGLTVFQNLQDSNLVSWIWQGYLPLNQEYKTLVKIVLFAQVFVEL